MLVYYFLHKGDSYENAYGSLLFCNKYVYAGKDVEEDMYIYVDRRNSQCDFGSYI